MASNDDLMRFLKQMEEKREKEKEEMAETRRKERQEDRAEMIKLMENCIGEKVNEQIEPYKKRTERVEEGQSEIKEQVELLREQMKSVNEILSGRSDKVQSSSTVTMAEAVKRQSLSPSPIQLHGGDNQEVKNQELISLSRRTVGLQRIDRGDIQRMYQEQYGGATSEEEAKLLAVKEYLKLELKLSEGTIQEMEIERIFTPAREDPEWLYVTFRYEVSVSRIFEKTRIMRKNSRIMTYIPKEYRSRFEAIRDLGNKLRFEEDCKTRIKMGYRDLQLHRKDRSSGKWELVSLPTDFPPLNFGTSPEKVQPGSPAPGRPEQEQSRGDKRSRESSGSTGQSSAKSARCEESHDHGRESDDNTGEGISSVQKESFNKETGTANPCHDTAGKVIDEESYCPASPAPSKPVQSFPYSSPIFSKSKTNSLTTKSVIN